MEPGVSVHYSCGLSGCADSGAGTVGVEAGLDGSTLGARIGRIAPDSGRGVGMAGWRGSGGTLGRADGGAANNDGVTGSGFGTVGAMTFAGGVGATAAGAGDGVEVVIAGALDSGSRGMDGAGLTTDAEDCMGVASFGMSLKGALAAIGCDEGWGAGVVGATGWCSGVVNNGGVMGGCSPITGADGVAVGVGLGVEALSPATVSDGRADSATRDGDGCSPREDELLRSASSSSMSRGVAGRAPFCATPACLRRRPPRRPRRRLPVPVASVAAGFAETSPPPALAFSAGFPASASGACIGAGLVAAGRCTS